MKSFLEGLAEHLHEHHPNGLSKVCVVLSNRRASLFLKKHLANIVGKVGWGPQVYSIEDFIHELSDDHSINSLKTIFELYEVHKLIEGKNAQNFDEFYNWGSILVQDFNELDLHLVDAENLYNYLSEVKSLAEWKLEYGDLSTFQTNYLKFFKSLKTYYQQLNKRLKERNLAYNGMLFRSVAENIKECSKKLQWDHIIFAGFNALSLAEEKIFFTLKELNLAEFLWDVDEYYLHHTNSGVKHEAGLFFRKYFKIIKEPNLKWVEQNLKTDTKNIQIYGIPKQIGQAKFCGQLLAQNQNILSSSHKSAIVLADENLLIPVLNSIPASYSEINVTMGLPLSSSPLFGFFNHLFKIQIYSENKKNTLNDSKYRYRHSDISKCLKHSVINQLDSHLFNSDTFDVHLILNQLKHAGQLDFDLDEISLAFSVEKYDENLVKLLFAPWNNEAIRTIEVFQQIIEVLRDATIIRQITNKIDLKIELEILYQFSILINKISDYHREYGSINTVKILHAIFIQICNTQKLPLFGEPLKGMQLMGMLESRNLDFDNLIILSVNENILPSSGKQNSFIPFELKREFNIPTYREKNAIFAYHFFRLIQRAKNISIIYNSQADLLAGGDKSRFILQITNELSKYNSKIKITEKSVSSPIKLTEAKPISITKNKEVLDSLDELSIKGISASSLNSYIKCQLQFYFKQIAKLGEPDETNETVDAAALGTIIHEALRNFYLPYKNKILKANDLKIQFKKADQFVSDAFKIHYKNGNIKYGKNLLVVNVARELFKGFIQHEINELKNTDKNQNSKSITFLEEKFNAFIEPTINGKPKKIKLHGFIDRIQDVNGITEVIDYKTGVVEYGDLKIKTWDELITNKKYDKAFQILLYAWMYSKTKNNITRITSGIYPIKRISKGFLSVRLPDKKNDVLNKEDLNNFQTYLSKLLVEIYDPSLKFEQTDDLATCQYCTYASICNK